MRDDNENRAALTIEDALQQIAAGEWEYDADFESWAFAGGDDPSWSLDPSGLTLTREVGWYKQLGEARDLRELVQLARAMDAACTAINDHLREAQRNA